MKFLPALLACALVMGSINADAARIGGGRSMGRQSANVTQRHASPPPPATPGVTQGTQQQAAPARPAQPAGPTAQAPRRPWGAMLGGLAAGLGLAWLAHSLGFGPALAQFMLIALLVLVVMVVIGLIRRGRSQAANAGGRPFAFQGAGAPAEQAPALRQYSPDKVGNDASARPWEQGATGFDGPRAGGVQIGSALSGPQGWGIPPGFDVAGFVESAKRNFVSLQDAWDRADIALLRGMMTDEMLAEVRTQLAERGAKANKTEVVMLEAQLLGIEELADDYMASVEFSGMIREEPSAGPSPFREVWNMVKPRNGQSGWLVAGVQALQ
jgi:predicted lipid-binding transport protein (Tim44 family)